MRLLLTFLLVLTFLACINRKEKKNLTKPGKENSTWLSDELYSKLLEYQIKYPIPKDGNPLGLYVYEASFFKIKADTFLLIWRSSEGSIALGDKILLGPYKDDSLSPTIIKDSKEFYGRNFIKKEISDSIGLNKFKPLKGEHYPENYPPNHTFLIKGSHLILNRIDTIWKEWDE